MNESFLNQLEWRFATKAFDPEKSIAKEDLERILNAILLSPSSFGLQPYHVHVITQQQLKNQIRQHSWNQAQVEDCSHFLVFSARTDLNERIDDYFKLRTGADESKREALKSYEAMMRGFAEERSPEWIENWAGKQAYIALGFAMAACAELGIDSCPMEGFDHQKLDEILELPKQLKSAVCLAIGYRKGEAPVEKVRFPRDELFSFRD